MKLADARTAILHALGRMNALYNQPVFNEWVLVQLVGGQGAILAYDGPRAESYQARLKADIAPLRSEMDQRALTVGDFEFVSTAHGTHFDACIRLGATSYLFCNNTAKSMAEIRQDPLWLSAQKPFVDLSAKFRADPLE